MNPERPRSDAAFIEGMCCAAACLPEADLDILYRGLGQRVAGSPLALNFHDLAQVVTACAEALERPSPSFAFDHDDLEGALKWLEGLLLGIGLYAEEWQSAMEEHPGCLMATTLLGSVIKPEVTGLPGVATAARDLANSPAGIIELVQTIYFDLRQPPQDFDAWPAADGEDGFDPEQQALAMPPIPLRHASKVGRNDPCPCGSGLKYKKCCLNKP